MSFIQQFINDVCHIFGELENINEYYVKFNVIQLIKKKFNQCIVTRKGEFIEIF